MLGLPQARYSTGLFVVRATVSLAYYHITKIRLEPLGHGLPSSFLLSGVTVVSYRKSKDWGNAGTEILRNLHAGIAVMLNRHQEDNKPSAEYISKF